MHGWSAEKVGACLGQRAGSGDGCTQGLLLAESQEGGAKQMSVAFCCTEGTRGDGGLFSRVGCADLACAGFTRTVLLLALCRWRGAALVCNCVTDRAHIAVEAVGAVGSVASDRY